MQLHVIKYVLTNETIHALFWTLVHSLWQGILLAFVTGIILMLSKKSGAALRYKLFSVVLLAFIFISVFTFYYEINFSVESKKVIPFITNNAITANTNVNIKHEPNLTEKIILFFQSGEDLIVLAWILIIILKSIRLLTGLRKIHLLKYSHVFDAGEYWNCRLKELAAKIGVTKPVVLLKSAIAEIPMVAGHLKPIILFPAVALTALPHREIEAILLHELAHIRRKDYLVNILQSFAEIIFFFNPAVLWISSLIKEERENCCDDIAIGEVKNKKQFIHALVSFQEYNITSKYAAFFAGRKSHLMNRVKRIITNNNKTLNNMEKIFLASGIIITGFMAVAFSQHKQPSFAPVTAVIQPAKTFVPVNKKDTVAPTRINNNESTTVINTSMDGKQYRLIEVNGKVTELYVDNARISGDKISEYKPVIERLHEKMKADKAKQAEEMEMQKEALAAQAELMKENELAMNDEMAKQAEEMESQKEVLKAQAESMGQNEELTELEKQKQVEQYSLLAQAETLKQNKELIELKKQADQMEQIQKELIPQSDLLKQKEELMKLEMLKQKDKLMAKDKMEYDSEKMKLQKKELAANVEMMKKQSLLMKEQMEKQTEQIKVQQKKLMEQSEEMKKNMQAIKAEMDKQAEKLKTQQQELIQQLNQKIDSIRQSKPTEPTLNKPQK